MYIEGLFDEITKGKYIPKWFYINKTKRKIYERFWKN
jgi:hypothetical protein